MFLALLLFMFGCAEEVPTDDPDPNPIEDDSCGESAPTISSVDVRGVERDGVFFTVGFVIDDADGSLHAFRFNVWLDDVVDGAVDTTGTPFQRGDLEPDGASTCGLDEYFVIAASEMGVDNDLEYNTRYEVAVDVVDADGNRSEVVIASGYSPNEDGSPGGE